MKVFSVLLAVLSALIVWSEVTFFSRKPVLSLAALIVELAGYNNDYAFIEVQKVYLFIVSHKIIATIIKPMHD